MNVFVTGHDFTLGNYRTTLTDVTRGESSLSRSRRYQHKSYRVIVFTCYLVNVGTKKVFRFAIHDAYRKR